VFFVAKIGFRCTGLLGVVALLIPTYAQQQDSAQTHTQVPLQIPNPHYVTVEESIVVARRGWYPDGRRQARAGELLVDAFARANFKSIIWSNAAQQEKRQPIRYALRVFAIVLVAAGVIWILQGINVLPGSFMTGQIQWAYRGGIAAFAGVAILLFARRRK
jgi:hypothetical protein